MKYMKLIAIVVWVSTLAVVAVVFNGFVAWLRAMEAL